MAFEGRGKRMVFDVSSLILGFDKQKMDCKIPTMSMLNALNLEASN